MSNWWKKWSKDVPAIVGFIVIAGLMWWVRAMDSTRDATFVLPISYTGLDELVQMDDDLPQEITIEVHDSGKRIRQIGRSKPTINISLSKYTRRENGKFSIPLEVLHDNITDVLPGTTSLQRFHPSHIDNTYFRLHSKEVPVIFTGTVVPKAQYQLDGHTTIHPKMITVYAKPDILNSVASVKTDSQQIVNVKGEMTVQVPLQPISGVKMQQNHVEIHVNAEQYTEKRWTAAISIRHLPEGKQIRLFPSNAEITARVSVNHYKDVKDEDVILYCNYPHGEKDNLTVKVENDNRHITNIRITPSIVEYLIEE